MKKIIEFYQVLPEEVRDKAVWALQNFSHEISDDYEPEDLADAIDCFDWDMTDEGWMWWSDIYGKAQEGGY